MVTCPCLLFPAQLTEVSIYPFVCVRVSNFCQLASLLICLSVPDTVAGEYTVEKKKKRKKKQQSLLDR